MKLPLVILAGGLGKRLKDKTSNSPKALIDIFGKPFISRQLIYLQKQGFNKIIICTAYLGKKIKNYVGNGKDYGMDIKYSDDGDQFLGTGGAIKKALKFINKDFFILYGDSYLPIDFSSVEKVFFNEGKPALMTVLKNSGQWDKSNAYFKNKLVYYNKKKPKVDMNYIDYGLSVVNNSIFNDFPDGKKFDLAEVFENLSQNKLLAGLEVNKRFYEIGSINGLNETINFFKNEKK
jgi:NDP-sugar pyrophosphorylase family protein